MTWIDTQWIAPDPALTGDNRPVAYSKLMCDCVGGVPPEGTYPTLMGIPGSGMTAVFPEVELEVWAWVDNNELIVRINGWWRTTTPLYLTQGRNWCSLCLGPNNFSMYPTNDGPNPSNGASDIGWWTMPKHHTSGSWKDWELFWDAQEPVTIPTGMSIDSFLYSDSLDGIFYIGAAVWWPPEGGIITNPITIPAFGCRVRNMRKLVEYFPASVRNASGQYRSCNRPYTKNVETAGYVQRWDGSKWIDRKNTEGTVENSTVYEFTQQTSNIYDLSAVKPAPRVGEGG